MTTRYWGDPIAAHLPEGAHVQVSHMHEGVIVQLLNVDASIAVLSAEAARDLADSLRKAADQWEE